jgi:O-acetyl-ADP-ribose deacetylase (regulator of RNase III)
MNDENIKIYLRDKNEDIVEAWTWAFAGYENVNVSRGDIFDIKADSIISPANSFGFMDGGIDLAYSRYFSWKLQEVLQEKIHNEYYGEIPVGMATIIETGNKNIPYLISCPTMRVPEVVEYTVNAYLAFRAALIEVINFNGKYNKNIQSILCPGLGTLTGAISPINCAKQMKYAYDVVLNNKSQSFKSLSEPDRIQMKLINDKKEL